MCDDVAEFASKDQTGTAVHTTSLLQQNNDVSNIFIMLCERTDLVPSLAHLSAARPPADATHHAALTLRTIQCS